MDAATGSGDAKHGFAKKMKPRLLTVLLVSVIVGASSTAAEPTKPTVDQIAEILGIEGSHVSIDEKDQHPKLAGKVIWISTYKIGGEQSCGLVITLIPDDQIKTEFIERFGANGGGLRKITKEDGDAIYHALVDRGPQGTSYTTILINHENDWDMLLTLAHEPDVDESKLPFVIAEDGIGLIRKIESALRNQ